MFAPRRRTRLQIEPVRGVIMSSVRSLQRPRRRRALTQFWCDVVDGGVERLAVVGPLGVKRGDPLRQPDGLLPAGTQRGAFSAGTLDPDGADLSVSQRFTRIDPPIDRPEQCGQRVHSACPLTGPSALEPQPGPELPSATPQREVAAAARYRPPAPTGRSGQRPLHRSYRQRAAAPLPSTPVRRPLDQR